MAWSLISPANRGIGFYLSRHLLQNTNIPIVATTRKDTSGVKQEILKGLENVDEKRLTVLELDVTNESSISLASKTCSTLFPPKLSHLRLAFIIPGILHPEKSPLQLSYAELTSTFAVNTIGPMLMAKHFLPFLPKRSAVMDSSSASSSPSFSTAAKELHDGNGIANGNGNELRQDLPSHAIWLTMSARVGSTTENALGGWYSYRASKAGVNSFTKGVDIWLWNRCREKAMAVAYHPGTVRTGLSREFWGSVERKGKGMGDGKEGGKEKSRQGGKAESGLLEPEDAVRKMVDVVWGLNVEEARGKCWDWRGKEVLP